MAQRVFDDGNMPREQRELYMLGLKAMLQEMIRRRGDAPYGHTQQLAIAWPDGVPLTRPLVHAAGGMKPPLAAGRSVWRKFDANRAHVKFAPRPRTEHLRAAELERLFWRKVTYKPFFQGEPKVGPLVWVRDKLAPITFVSPSPSGHYLAVGTATGAVVVFDLRHEPSNPWFEVVPESSGSAGAPRCPGLPRPAVLALTWSVDSYQLLALDNTDTVRVWWMRPAPGQIIKQVDTDQRQPVEPDLALSMGPPAMATSGKAPIDDSGRVAQEQGRLGGAGAFVGVRAECVAFHRSFNLTGSQPSILVPQITGDILRIHASVCGAALPIPLARSRRTAGAAVGRDGRAPLAARTVDFLMPPQVKSTDASGQSIYRGHMGRVVYVAFLSDNTTAVSVDDLGTTNLWPAQETERTGFGWFQPSASWTPPRQLKTWRAWGPSYPLWPRKPATVGFTLFGFIGKVPDQASGLSFEDYMSEPALFDNDGELQQLEEFPMGNFLLERRILWMVRYRPEGAGHGGSAKPDPKRPGRIVREELHRPDARAGGKIGGMEPLVASTYDPPSGSLLRRSKQHVSMAKYDYKVVSASLTHSQRDLLLWCHVSAAADDPDSFSFFSCHVLNIEAMKPLTPRIDVYDHSMGACPPAFATSPTISSLGSEYMFVGLGYGHVGVFSLATGQQVSEVNYSMHEAPYFMCLSLFTISDAHGCSTRNVGKTILCAVAPDSRHVHMLEVNDELSTLEAAAARQARAAAAHASAVGGGGSSPGSPRSPHGGHHGGIPLPPLPSSPGPPGLRLGSASLAASASGRAASVPTAAMGSGGGGGGRLSRASSGREGEDPAGTDGSRGESSGGEGGGGAVGQRSSSTPGGAAAARAASPRAGNGGSSGVRAGSR
ncbi:hypothetical protein FOA52_004379 [Chlamydomonas sp. UWO 241]|nr:hypothetical protein FOA52_004379 [Chlamydomonas sp. UWO 241]